MKKVPVNHPYIPGLFMLTEGKPLLRIIRLLKNQFDVLIIDGRGILHPRKCGLASYVGIILTNINSYNYLIIFTITNLDS